MPVGRLITTRGRVSGRMRFHEILFKAGICALENVVNMDQLPAKGSEIIVLPMKIEGGTGAPARIVAIFH